MAHSSSSSNKNTGIRAHCQPRNVYFLSEEAPSSGAQGGQSSGLQFDVIQWYPKYASCQKYFLDHAQHSFPVQAFAAFINILLPFQKNSPTADSWSESGPDSTRDTGRPEVVTARLASHPTVSLIPYIRRLVATGMDAPPVLHGFFGDDWAAGIGPQREQERRNYLFAAKSGGWASVKKEYDMLPLETIPFLRLPHEPTDAEIEAAERSWSEWLALEDWMVGSRAPSG